LLAAIACVFVLAPILSGTRRHRENERMRLEAQKEALVQLLRDLEFDRRTGKLSEADYEAAREEAELRAISVLASLEVTQSRWSRSALEAEIGKMREQMSRRRRA
jgi:cytochrome c-type biogenesis protein CcmI